MIDDDPEVGNALCGFDDGADQSRIWVGGVEYQAGAGEGLESIDEAGIFKVGGEVAVPEVAVANTEEELVAMQAVEIVAEGGRAGHQVADNADDEGRSPATLSSHWLSLGRGLASMAIAPTTSKRRSLPCNAGAAPACRGRCRFFRPGNVARAQGSKRWMWVSMMEWAGADVRTARRGCARPERRAECRKFQEFAPPHGVSEDSAGIECRAHSNIHSGTWLLRERGICGARVYASKR